MNKNYYFLSCCLLLFFTCQTPIKEIPKPPKKPQNPHLQGFVKQYEQQFEALLASTNTPGAGLVIVKDTEVLHLKGYGTKSAYSNDSVDVNTVFRIGSLSKGFASVLAGILVEDGKLKWTDKVNKYVPEFVLKDPSQSNRVNLIHLLSQSSGLPYHAYTNLIEAGVTPKNIAKELKKVNLISKEGEVYAYQNAAYSLIGNIIEKVEKKSLPKIFNQQLFSPLKVKNTSTDYQSLVGADNIALPHSGGNGNWRNRKISKKYYNAIPAGGINASIADMGEWLQLLLGNHPEIISEKTLAEIFQPRINSKNRRRYFRNWDMVNEAYYGLGWRVLTNAQDTFIYHGGYVNGYRGEILLDPKEKLGICVLANAPSKMPKNSILTFLKTYAEKQDSIHAWEDRQVNLEVVQN